jgi:hypothetical protein
MLRLFVWSGDPGRLPLIVVREIQTGKTVGLYVVIAEKPERKSFDALKLRVQGDPVLRPVRPSSGFGAIEPSRVPGRGTASLSCRHVSYEQIGLHIGAEFFESIAKTSETTLERGDR